MIKILQINIRSLRTNKAYLESYLRLNDIEIALISESWLKRDQPITFSNYSIVRADRNDGYGGSAILIKNSVHYKELQLPSHFNNDKIQTSAIKLKAQNLELTVLSVYCSPSHKLTTDHWCSLIRAVKTPILLCGDLNCHYRSFGCSYDDAEGRSLLDALSIQNLCLLNDGSPTLLQRHDRRPSAVDLSICSPSLAPRIEWVVLEEPFGSDHLGIKIIIDKHIIPNPTTPFKKWNLKSAQWAKYASLSDNFISDMTFSDDINQNYVNFVKCISKAAESSIPQFKPYLGKKSKHPPKPWWDEECDRARDNNIKAYKLFKSTPNLLNFINCKRATAFCRKVYKIKKKEKWAEFCNSFNRCTPIKEIWSGVRALRQGYSVSKNAPVECLPEILSSLTPESAVNEVLLPNSGNNNDKLEDPFSYYELNLALKTNSNTSPGEDGIHYPMLTNLSTYGKKVLLRVLNDVWIQESRIDDWSSQVIVPLLKPNKDPSLPDSYRPIALSSCIGKTFERLMKARLEWWLEFNNKIPPYQQGFRKKHSTLDALAGFVLDIQKCFSDNEYLLAANIDLSNAYNCVDVPILVKKMNSLGVPGKFIRLIYHFLSYRKITVRGDGTIIGPRQSHMGLPQGAVLSPLLFNIYTTDLQAVVGTDVSVSQYADDIVVYCQEASLDIAKNRLNVGMTLFNSWCKDLGFSLSEKKSRVTLFTRHRKYCLGSFLTIGGFKLRVEPTTKTLGMVIDRKLLWRQHIEQLIKKCEQSINVLRCINRLNHGADIQTSLTLYRQLVLSRMDYGCYLYGDAAKSHLAKVDKLQFRALRACLGALKSTPTNALLVEARDFPLEIRRKFMASHFVADRLVVRHHPVIEKIFTVTGRFLNIKYWSKKRTPVLVEVLSYLSHFSSSVNQTDQIPSFSFSYQTLSTDFSPFIDTKLYPQNNTLPNAANNTEFMCTLQIKYPNCTHFYTDGSKTSEGVGCSIYDPQNNLCDKFNLNKEASIFTAELTAVNRCLYKINELKIKRAIILSDCKSVLESLKNPGKNPSWLVMSTLSLLLDCIVDGGRVYLVWVRGHCGLTGNERADEGAKQATSIGHQHLNILSPADLKTYYKAFCYKKWQHTYLLSAQTKGKFYFAIQSTIPVNPWYKNRSESRKFFTTLCRLRFNHNFSPHHLSRIGVNVEPLCSCDSESPADANHIILSCSQNTIGRDELWRAVVDAGCPMPANLLTILARPQLYHHLYRFIVNNKIVL